MGKWINCKAGDINAATQRFWVALGADADLVARGIISEPGLVEALATHAKILSAKAPKKAPEAKSYFIGYDLADTILGDDFISPTEVEGEGLGGYSNGQIQEFVALLPDREELEQLREAEIVLMPSSPKSRTTEWLKIRKENLKYNQWEYDTYWAVRGK